LTSPRNSPTAQGKLFEALKCNTLVTIDPTPPPALAILEAVKPRKLAVPSADQLLSKAQQHYDSQKTYEKNGLDPVWVM
jgi:hypothetical protein